MNADTARRRRGFTMIEMTAVMLIVTTLATLAIPQMASAYNRARDGSSMTNLGVLRSALDFYYGAAGQYPPSLAALKYGYVSEVPPVRGLIFHAPSDAVHLETTPSDKGGWSYDNVPGDANYGRIVINCTHVDRNGKPWSQY